MLLICNIYENFFSKIVDSKYYLPHKDARSASDSSFDQARRVYRMNKAQLVQAVHKTLGNSTSRAESERALNAVVEAIKVGLRKEKVVQLIGFGTFRVSERAARMGMNPQTREKIKIKKSKTVKFSVAKNLKVKL